MYAAMRGATTTVPTAIVHVIAVKDPTKVATKSKKLLTTNKETIVVHRAAEQPHSVYSALRSDWTPRLSLIE